MTLAAFEELDYAMTPLGELILRRREVLALDRAEVYEVKLDSEFLMSSIVNDAEIALADFALPLVACDRCDVLVGGLGLGYTAKAALEAANVAGVTVVEYLPNVISWHERELVPLGRSLTRDARCKLICADFFAIVGAPPAVADESHQPHNAGARPAAPADQRPDTVAELGSRRYHAILLDIDHSPQCLLRDAHGSFYTVDGLTRLVDRLHAGGVFALWSADPPERALADALDEAFATVQVRESRFYNPLLDLFDVNYIVVAQRD